MDNPKQREFILPYEILEKLGLREGDIIADIDCGIGYFSIPAADIVGSKGIVYAMDIELEMIDETERRAAGNGMANIRPIVTAEYDMKVGNSTVSFAFACLVLHEVRGPPAGHRLESGYVKQILQDCGFKNVSTTDINEYFYAVMASK